VSIANVLLLIVVAIFSIAVLLPVVSWIEHRFRWSRSGAASAVMLCMALLTAVVVLVLVQAFGDAVRRLSHDLPHLVQSVRDSSVGGVLNGKGNFLDTLKSHTSDITKNVGKVTGGVAHVGLSAFGAVTLILSLFFLTLFGLLDAPRTQAWIAGLMYPDTRERYLRVSDRIVHSTSRYMLGNLAISVICGTVYGTTAVILDVPYPLALAVVAGILDLVPNIGATLAGIIIALVSLSVSLGTAITFVIVIVVYQQVENYVLQPTIIGKVAQLSSFTVLISVLAFGALFGLIGAIIAVPIAAGIQIVTEELTAARRERIAELDSADSHELPADGAA
jgi:predicted PurR-regulated permease PerM